MQHVLKVGDILFKLFSLRRAAQDIFAVDVAELYLRDVLRLNLVYPEADHQVRHDLSLKLCAADDLYRTVDIEQDALKTLQKVQLLFFLLKLVVHAATDTFRAPSRPLLKNFRNAHHARAAADEDVEVAGEAVLKRCEPEELLHQLFGVDAAL